MNYELQSGCFNGEIIAEGTCILDVPFAELDAAMQEAIRDWSCTKGRDWTISEAQREYELSWDSYESDKEVTLKPISEWKEA